MKRGIGTALLCALASSLAGCTAGRDAAEGDLLAASGATPGFEARAAALVETGPDGAPRYRVSAQTIAQDPASRVVRLETVRMRIEDDAAARWDIAAARGIMPADADAIELYGDVRIVGTHSGGQGPIEIRSDEIRYEFAAAVARSGSAVTILYSGQRLAARGLEARLKERRVRLESDVHGRFTR